MPVDKDAIATGWVAKRRGGSKPRQFSVVRVDGLAWYHYLRRRMAERVVQPWCLSSKPSLAGEYQAIPEDMMFGATTNFLGRLFACPTSTEWF